MVATMDRSIGRLPDPLRTAPNGERRRCVRQKLHTPVYASFNGPQTGLVVDLSELLDLHEEGFAVQTSERLEPNRAVTLCLDLPETRSFIHGSGQVVWSDETGRGGVRFSGLPESSRQVLKEWLFANLLIACSNHQARTEQLVRREEERLREPVPAAPPSPAIPISVRSERLSLLDTVRREVRELADDVDEVLQLITERALALTGASGAALAFLTEDRMICRARSGDPAPPIGAPVDVQHGLSGECVRSGLPVSCEDTESDPRVDPEVSRALGIGSLMACPIVSDFRVVGFLEIFFPAPRGFTRSDGTVLERLSELVPKVHREKRLAEFHGAVGSEEAPIDTCVAPSSLVPAAISPESIPDEPASLHAVGTVLREHEVEASEKVMPQEARQIASRLAPAPIDEPDTEAVPEEPSRLLYRALLGLAIAVVAMVIGYIVGPALEKRWQASTQTPQAPVVKGSETTLAASPRKAADHVPQGMPVADLQALADQGSADAQWQMAVRYHNGEGVPQDDTQAMKWYERAAEQGHVDAQSHLGAYYWAGRGVPEDLSKAYFWSTIAMAQGDENSKSRLEGLSSQMTRAQVFTARQQAEAWIHAHSSLKPAGN
jgi:hypothetical protein